MAKTAAIMQGIFLLLMFFLPEPPYAVFCTAVILTVLDLTEEIILGAYTAPLASQCERFVLGNQKDKLKNSPDKH